MEEVSPFLGTVYQRNEKLPFLEFMYSIKSGEFPRMGSQIKDGRLTKKHLKDVKVFGEIVTGSASQVVLLLEAGVVLGNASVTIITFSFEGAKFLRTTLDRLCEERLNIHLFEDSKFLHEYYGVYNGDLN